MVPAHLCSVNFTSGLPRRECSVGLVVLEVGVDVVQNLADAEHLVVVGGRLAAKTANVALKGLNSLLGSNKISKFEKENERLQGEISKRDDQIKKLQSDAEKQKEWHAEDIRYTKLQMQKTINEKQRTIDKILRWFPLVGEYLRVESECLMHGFSEEQTDKLVHGQALKFRGYLQADKRSPRVWAESVTAQIIKMAKDKLQLTVEQSPIVQWVQQQLERNKQERLSEEQKTSKQRGFHL